MYRFSRSIYRDLAPNVIVDPVNSGNGKPRSNSNGHPHANGHVSHNGRVNGNGRANGAHANGGHATGGHANGNAHPNGSGASNRQQLLDACEAAMRRLAYDRYFAHPARSLFGEVRMLFPIHEQDRAFRVIERNVNLALEHLARLPEQGASGLDGQPSECRAHTRKGTPCQRQPLPGRDYCPSHKHLEESLEPAAEIKLLDERAGEPQDPVSAAT